jgi:hypothetical protein
MRMAKKRKASDLDTSPYYPSSPLPVPLTALRHFRRGIAGLDGDLESCQFPSYQVEAPVILTQDSIASLESVDLKSLPQSVL